MSRIAFPIAAAAIAAALAWSVLSTGASAEQKEAPVAAGGLLLPDVLQPGDRFDLPPKTPRGVTIKLLSDNEVRDIEAKRQSAVQRVVALEAEHPWLKNKDDQTRTGEEFEISRKHNMAQIDAGVSDYYTVERVGRDYITYRHNKHRRHEAERDEIVHLPLHSIVAITEPAGRHEARRESD